MCGESTASANFPQAITGSPPQVWGKPIGKLEKNPFTRITPTCVGKAWLTLPGMWARWDHPHMCGESRKFCVFGCVFTGSPPHVWGKPGQDENQRPEPRITPTCVGKAPSCSIPDGHRWDHPHMCGESMILL